jgi:methionine aminopeptidase
LDHYGKDYNNKQDYWSLMESVIKDQAETTQLLWAVNYFSNYRYIKESLLWNEYINLENIIHGLTYEQYENIRQMIEVEEIVNAIQYCLELGAVAICVGNRKIAKLGYELANLSERGITDFYGEIKNKNIHQIKRYMGYHDIETDKNRNYKYVISCEKYQSIVGELSEFYFLSLTPYE